MSDYWDSAKFIKWLKTASGSELMKYKTKNSAEEHLIEIEINRRLEKNVPAIAEKVLSFFDYITKE